MAHFLVLLLTGYLGIHQCLYALYVPIHASDLSVALRTQRDIGQDITLDQYLWPALNLTSAYFGTDFSNTHLNSMSYLLDYGYLRFGIDVYWNDITSRWQICPEAGLDESIATDQRIHQSLCSPSGLKYFLGVINSHLCQTELLVSPMNTHLLVLILNLHTVGAQDATKDPMTRIDTLTSLLVSGISHTPRQNSRFYTPVDLMQSQREMGDGTGNGTGNGTGDRDGTGVVWPSWMHVVRQHKQLLVGFGSVSTLFNNITTLQDHPLIFRSGMLGTNVEFPLEEAFVTDACPSQNSTVGWSLWSDENEAWNATQVQQIINCGYSPFFERDNSTSETERQLQLFSNANALVWSWDTHQPDRSYESACAAMQQSNGRWQSTDCSRVLPVACRHKDDPHKWIVSDVPTSFERAPLACNDPYLFECPRQATENNALFIAIQNSSSTVIDKQAVQNGLVWIELNVLSRTNCWVLGKLGMCWWLNKSTRDYLGLIKTSASAGAIILIVFGCFVWVKCARLWRLRKSHKRKMMVQKMLRRREYITVPA